MKVAMRPLFILLAALSLLQAAAVRTPLKAPGTRKAAPAFTLLDRSGHRTALSSFVGKPLLLDLWATKCGGCVQEIPIFIEMDHQYARQGLAVVGISMDILYEDLKGPAEAWALVNPFVQARKISYPILMGDEGITKNYSVTALPVTYLIDKHGRVAATYVGVVDRANVDENIRLLLAEQ